MELAPPGCQAEFYLRVSDQFLAFKYFSIPAIYIFPQHSFVTLRMNYFELFEIPVSLIVDQNKLSSQYLALQKKYHPDFFAGAGKDVQAEAWRKFFHGK